MAALGGGGAPCAPLWQRFRATVVFVHQTARPTRFSTRKAVQGGAEGAWGLGSECCGQALRWRRVCAPVLRRQRCACERLTSRGVRGRVGFRFGRPVFWAGAGAEASVGGRGACRPALGSEAGPAPDERRGARADAGAVPSGRGRTPQAPFVELNIFTRRRGMYCSLWCSDTRGCGHSRPRRRGPDSLLKSRARSNLPERTMSRPRVDGVE